MNGIPLIVALFVPKIGHHLNIQKILVFKKRQQILASDFEKNIIGKKLNKNNCFI